MQQIASGVFLLQESGPSVCSNVYVLEGKKSVCLIDSGTDHTRLDFLEKSVESVFFTHGHFDHVLAAVTAKWPGLLHKEDLENLEELNAKFVKTPRPVFFKPLPGRVRFDEFEFKVIHTPGHTQGSVCLLDEKRRLLFSGDTLFADGFVGRTDLWGGNADLLKESLDLVGKLDFELLCPGHGKTERKTVPV